MILSDILGIFLSVVWAMTVGFVWYSPSVAGTAWAKLSGLDLKKLNTKPKEMMSTFMPMIALNVLTALILQPFFKVSQDMGMSILLVVLLWLVFTFIPTATSNLFSKKPLMLTVINTVYNLITFIGMSLILMFV